MNAKDYLSQAYRLDKKINSKLEQLATLKEMATRSMGSVRAKQVCGIIHSPMEDSVIRSIDLQHEINDEIDRLVDLKHDLAKFISGIDNAAYRIILELRYLGGNSWDQVADRLGYDLHWVYRLHGKALQEAEQRLNKNGNEAV